MQIDELAMRFSERARQRGEAYQRAGLVTIKQSSPTSIRAAATGTENYDVRIAVDGRTLVLSCSCPAFDSDGPCKHLWATALVAAERRMLAAFPSPANVKLAAPRPESRRPDWETLFFPSGDGHSTRPSQRVAAPPTEILYVVEVDKTRLNGELTISLRTRAARKKGGFAKDKAAAVPVQALELLPDARDRRALPLLQAAATLTDGVDSIYDPYAYAYGSARRFTSEASIPPAMADEIMPLLAETGRLFIRREPKGALVPAAYDGNPPWEFVLTLSRDVAGAGSEISGRLQRGAASLPLSAPLLVTNAGWVLFEHSVGRLRHFDAFAMLASLRGSEKITLPAADEEAFLTRLYAQRTLPRLALPEDLSLEERPGTPIPHLKIGPPAPRLVHWGAAPDRPTAELSFHYDTLPIAPGDPRKVIASVSERRLMRRDRDAEAAAVAKFREVGFQRAPEQPGDRLDFQRYDIARARLAGAVRTLVDAGWRVVAEGKLYRQAGNFALSVTSGVDWFDLQGELDFDGVSATLPELLRALRRGETMVRLGDGSFGMLPEEWLKKYAPLAEMGGVEGDRLRFRRAQAGLLDALLASEPEVSVDAQFAKARDELRQFTGVRPAKAPRAFRGELRPYQEAGLGWLSFLRQFAFGGCLADDMGLGKTIQVLAMLAGRPRRNARPSIVVVPKSLVWNWEQEAARFAPKLRVLAHVGSERAASATALRKRLAGVDLLVTTYGVLRKDAAFLREIEADYVILDEAQAIKNADSESAKAARLLRGDHRLALSGTPIENHLGELWSLVEFLNPGMLGTARAFAGAAGARRLEPETIATLARALRPFILRRTKEEVAPELPRKHEETILCEMEPEQRRLYEELRTHYRGSLLGKIAKDGLGKAKIQVLEALLRLRQVACHPGLVDKKRAALGSGKMDVLLARLEEVRREGHKALVFSQFTSFLALLRERLDAAKVPYEYLDGATQDRQARVAHFQTDDNCPLFLLSLKAGGVGLNLTAADYVFILDPWWNPAAEAQAVDRAHRIGQEKRVFVYRLLCRDSVEEKVAALQETKRDLAASIIAADGSVMQKLDKETLELLLA
jgi:superfamily II DNA or RNA helicase